MGVVVTVLVSAAVSGLVALGMEYAAKPRLEARKELLLEAYRRRRELRGFLDMISMISGSWSVLPPRERDRAWSRLDSMTEKMFDDVWSYAGSYRRAFKRFGRSSSFDLIGQYSYAARGVFLRRQDQDEAVRALGELTGPLGTLLEAGWRLRVRYRAVEQMERVLTVYAGRGSATEAGPVPEAARPSR